MGNDRVKSHHVVDYMAKAHIQKYINMKYVAEETMKFSPPTRAERYTYKDTDTYSPNKKES